MRAPRFLGAFFCAVTLLFSFGCRKKETPDWEPAVQKYGHSIAPEETQPVSGPTPAIPQRLDLAGEEDTSSGFRFMSYNVRNWLTMDRYVGRKNLKGAPKPESERKAVIEIIARHSPDVIGLSEIGTREDLAEIQSRLRQSGLDLPHSHYSGGTDVVRHLGMLSRFPIVSTARPLKSHLRWEGQTISLNRGILDATLNVNGRFYRMLGVHLKSKREIEGLDQESIRRGEAHLLRSHVDAIFDNDPDVRLVVYGDFNDTRSSIAVKTILGNPTDPTCLTPIPFADHSGETWTHFWELHEIYTRIDFVGISRRLKDEIDLKASKIIDDPDWNDASDHRPVWAVFR
jgi:endonuclease/exonuclease/phosphatase family metal-dependent hydrolase